MYAISQNAHGFYITKETNGRTFYLSKIGRNNDYIFLSDYTYTKYFSKGTAQKHIDILKRSEST